MTDDFVRASLGAVVGFTLAQLVNFAKIGWSYWRQPRLTIQEYAPYILSHYTELTSDSAEMAKEIIFGFEVLNRGRSMARGVKSQILSGISYTGSKEIRKHNFVLHTASLARYDIRTSKGEDTVDLVPGGTALIELARWREDRGAILPSSESLGEYGDEILTRASRVEFHVCAWDNEGRYRTKKIMLNVP
jgi:hypothetical protein